MTKSAKFGHRVTCSHSPCAGQRVGMLYCALNSDLCFCTYSQTVQLLFRQKSGAAPRAKSLVKVSRMYACELVARWLGFASVCEMKLRDIVEMLARQKAKLNRISRCILISVHFWLTPLVVASSILCQVVTDAFWGDNFE